jgi:hypothetical protein
MLPFAHKPNTADQRDRDEDELKKLPPAPKFDLRANPHSLQVQAVLLLPLGHGENAISRSGRSALEQFERCGCGEGGGPLTHLLAGLGLTL